MNLISIPEIAERFHADPSLIRKRLKEMKIKTVTAIRGKTKKSTTAISKKDLTRLTKKYPNMKAPKAKATDVPVSQVASKLGRDISTVLKMCASRKIKLTVKKVVTPSKKKVKTNPLTLRAVKTISVKDFNLLKKEVKTIPVV